MAPPTVSEYSAPSETFLTKDFVELKYAIPVNPTKITIFETCNTGFVVRILAGTIRCSLGSIILLRYTKKVKMGQIPNYKKGCLANLFLMFP